MARLTILKLLMVALSIIASFSIAAQNQNIGSYLQDTTPWGDPNIQGTWDRRTITPLERPDRLGDKAFLTPDEIVDYERASAAREDGRPLDFSRTTLSVHDPADLDYGSTVYQWRN